MCERSRWYVLQWSIDLQYNHSKICTYGKVYVHKDKRKNKGLVSTIVFKCTMTQKTQIALFLPLIMGLFEEHYRKEAATVIWRNF
jgi:hypothetical protein